MYYFINEVYYFTVAAGKFILCMIIFCLANMNGKQLVTTAVR